jgi:hypothetical protein
LVPPDAPALVPPVSPPVSVLEASPLLQATAVSEPMANEIPRRV